jgi:UDP-glucose 4-epimerase
VLPFWGTGLAASALRRLGVDIPPEALNQLRFGRGLDNRRYKATGFRYGYTTREAVIKLGEHLRLHPLLRGGQEPYRYEREVEHFLRWSPHVKNVRERPPGYGRVEADAAESEQEERVRAAERAAERAVERAKKAERRAGEAVEEAVRRSRAEGERRERPLSSPVEHYDDLAAEEVIALLASLERDDLQTLRDYERQHANRARVLSAIDSVLARRETAV